MDNKEWQDIIDDYKLRHDSEPWAIIGAMAYTILELRKELEYFKMKEFEPKRHIGDD